MKSVFISIWCLLLLIPSFAQDHLFSLQHEIHQITGVDQLFTKTSQIEPFTDDTPVGGLAISGQFSLHSDSSLIRIILLDDRNNEYLVFESYALLADSGTFSIEQFGEETLLLNQVIASSIRLEIQDASIFLDEIITAKAGTKKSGIFKEELLHQQDKAKIQKINQNLKKRNIPWMAGETNLSRMSYAEKKAYFGGDIPHLSGLEYYSGGVFVLPGILEPEDPRASNSTSADLGTSSYVKEFSWTHVHGQNWVTPVKNQGGCNSCWAFGATAAAELLVNLYYNRSIDYDLSEQQLIACTSGNCSLGAPVSLAIDYIRTTGIVTEDCFPYTGSDQDCSEICANPRDRIQIEAFSSLHKENEKKRAILNGATTATVSKWAHTVQVLGFKLLEEGDTLYVKHEADSSRWMVLDNKHPLLNRTAWLCKNSWGETWGDKGYVYVVGKEQDITMHSLLGPASSLIYKAEDIICSDSDGDGYYVWGNGPKPHHCPDSPPQADGDDSNRCLGPRDVYGNFTSITPVPESMDTLIVGEQKVPDLVASGENIRWYADKKLLNPVYLGNVYPTGLEEFGDYIFYATQTISGCESTPSTVSLSIWPEVPPPTGHDTLIKVGEPALLSAYGEAGAILTWYSDSLLSDSLFCGDVFDTQRVDIGTYTYYVTQTIYGNESTPAIVTLRIEDLVYIPDQAFLQTLIREEVDTNQDGIITYQEAGEVTRLDAGPGIWDMTGIEAFVNLDTLQCAENYFSHLDISKCHSLRYLDCSQNRLESLDISACSSLEYLNCNKNWLTGLDASACDLLEYLNCSGGSLTELNVSGCTSLLYLDISSTRISQLDLSTCVHLQKIDCNWSDLTRLDVSGFKSLETIECRSSELTYLDVSGCTSLHSIVGSSNELAHLNVSACVGLQHLEVPKNRLVNLDVSDCKKLHYLNCYENQLNSLDLSSNLALQNLICSHNKLTGLNLSGLTALQQLHCSFNQLRSLEVSDCPALESIRCAENLLDHLDVSNSARLAYLDCNSNQLAGLNVSACFALTRLICFNNHLSSMELSDCSSLELLICKTNNLNHLELSSCSALKGLYCSNNHLSSLALPDFMDLVVLECDDNQLGSLDLSSSPSLRYLDCSGNLLERLDVSNNPEIGSMDRDYPELSLANMPMLKEVCVWTLPFPPAGVNVDTTASPNIEFKTCSNNVEENEPNKFIVYPNPTSGLFTLETNLSEEFYMEVYTSNGRRVYEYLSHSHTHQMNLSGFPQGVYFITIRFRDSIRWKKISKL
jgi:Leucine-rich repeat (LRR) protein